VERVPTLCVMDMVARLNLSWLGPSERLGVRYSELGHKRVDHVQVALFDKGEDILFAFPLE
jgi:hypothetical protein